MWLRQPCRSLIIINLSDKDFFIVTTGAWFHDTGYFEDLQNHEQKGAELAVEFLKKRSTS
jgi:HD superfamily phosphodiesterase